MYIYESLRCNFVKVYKVLGLTNLTSTSRTSCLLGIGVPGYSRMEEKGASIWRDTASIVPFFSFINQIIKISISIIVVHADLFVCCYFFFFFLWAFNNYRLLNITFSFRPQNYVTWSIFVVTELIVRVISYDNNVEEFFYYNNTSRTSVSYIKQENTILYKWR